MTLWTVAAARLRLKGQPEVELGVDAILVLMVTLSAIITASISLTAMAGGFLIATTIVLTIASAPLFWPLSTRSAQEA